MNFLEILLGGKESLEVNGRLLSFVRKVNSDKVGRRTELLELTVGDQGCLEIENAIDNSQCLDCPRIFLIRSDKKLKNIILFGGENVYWIDISLLRVVKTIFLGRESQDVEYWQSKILGVKFGYLTIYEAGLFLIDENLDLVWHKKKYYNDRVELESNVVFRIVSDDEQIALYSLEDGEEV